MIKKFLLMLFFLTPCLQNKLTSQTLYFPPLNNFQQWDTLSPSSLGWCTNQIDSLYNFLQAENTKAFMVLKEGKIVLEKYFGAFTSDSLWYWASAGKTITSFLVGQAQESGLLSIQDTTSKYLGQGWTNSTLSQENKITIRNQLTMTSGLDDGVPDPYCTLDTCLNYLADAGTRWAYHNAPYTLLDQVLSNATGQNLNTLTNTMIKSRIGMTGLWVASGYNNVFVSTARSMARFGLLIQGRGIWQNDTLMHDVNYFNQMTNTSQNLNLSYGYLWWLNGKASYMLPGFQFVFPGSYAIHAPSDMFSALGKNGQIVSLSPSQGIVVIRMGNAPSSPSSDIATILCDQIWEYLQAIQCNVGIEEENVANMDNITLFPNPVNDQLFIKGIDFKENLVDLMLYDVLGNELESKMEGEYLDVSELKNGNYFLVLRDKSGQVTVKRFAITK
jgi:CubicO group peptidase (beta-lactamase class C family)